MGWRSFGSSWTPTRFRDSEVGAEAATLSWEIVSWLDPRESGGVQGIPRRVRIEAFEEAQQPFTSIVVDLEVTGFRALTNTPASAFRLDPDEARILWDEDSKMFLRHVHDQQRDE